MFTKLSLFRITAGLPSSADALSLALESAAFTPTSPTQEISRGWIFPRATGGPLVESVAGQWFARYAIEARKVPADTLETRVDEMVEKIEADTGRRPGRKERRAIKEDTLLALLPSAFPRQHHVSVWIDPSSNLLAVGATSSGHTDAIITSLVRCVDGLAIAMLNTAKSPASVMASWLVDGEPSSDDFDFGRDLVLQSDAEDRSAIRYSRHHLATEEVRRHIAEGKLPRSMGLSWSGRISFTLSDTLKLQQIKFLDGVFEGQRPDDADAFDADAAITSGELRRLIPGLLQALGGEVSQ